MRMYEGGGVVWYFQERKALQWVQEVWWLIKNWRLVMENEKCYMLCIVSKYAR